MKSEILLLQYLLAAKRIVSSENYPADERLSTSLVVIDVFTKQEMMQPSVNTIEMSVRGPCDRSVLPDYTQISAPKQYKDQGQAVRLVCYKL